MGTTLVGRRLGAIHAGTLLHIPITIEANDLAKSFETDDVKEALKPRRYVGKLAVTTKQELDDLVGLARALADKKRGGC